MTPALVEARLLIPDIQVEFEAKLNHAKDKLATVPRHQTGSASAPPPPKPHRLDTVDSTKL